MKVAKSLALLCLSATLLLGALWVATYLGVNGSHDPLPETTNEAFLEVLYVMVVHVPIPFCLIILAALPLAGILTLWHDRK